METTTILIISALTLVAALLSAIFAYPTWREYRQKPLLRLSFRPDSSEGGGPLKVVDNSGKGQIVFELTVHNDGDRAARFWRVWLAGQDKDTTILLNKRPPHMESRSFTDRSFIGSRWVSEVAAGIAADIVSPHASITLPGLNTINFPLEKTAIRLDFKLDADGMPTRAGVVRLEIDRATRTVRVELSDQGVG